MKTFTNLIRQDILKMIHNAKSGHPGGSLSCVELLKVLFMDNISPSSVRNCSTPFERDSTVPVADIPLSIVTFTLPLCAKATETVKNSN